MAVCSLAICMKKQVFSSHKFTNRNKIKKKKKISKKVLTNKTICAKIVKVERVIQDNKICG